MVRTLVAALAVASLLFSGSVAVADLVVLRDGQDGVVEIVDLRAEDSPEEMIQ